MNGCLSHRQATNAQRVCVRASDRVSQPLALVCQESAPEGATQEDVLLCSPALAPRRLSSCRLKVSRFLFPDSSRPSQIGKQKLALASLCFLIPNHHPRHCSCVTPKMRWKAGLESPSRVSLCMPVCLWTSWQRARALFGTSNWKQLMMTATATTTESEGLQFVEACAIILPHCISILAAFLCSARAFSHLQWWWGGTGAHVRSGA